MPRFGRPVCITDRRKKNVRKILTESKAQVHTFIFVFKAEGLRQELTIKLLNVRNSVE